METETSNEERPQKSEKIHATFTDSVPAMTVELKFRSRWPPWDRSLKNLVLMQKRPEILNCFRNHQIFATLRSVGTSELLSILSSKKQRG